MKSLVTISILLLLTRICLSSNNDSSPSLESMKDSSSAALKIESKLDSSLALNNDISETKPIYQLAKLATSLKDIFQILFFITVGVFTVMSFFLAKKALMDPLRNLVSKNLESKIEEIQSWFTVKTEYELRTDAHFLKMLQANIWKIRDIYAHLFLSFNLNQIGSLAERPYNRKYCPSSRKINNVSDHALTVIEYEFPEAAIFDFNFFKTMPSIEKEKIWKNYKIIWVELPKEFLDYEGKIRKMISTPYLPRKLKNLLSNYLSSLHNNIDLLGSQLNEYAQTLPKRFPESYPINTTIPTLFDIDSSSIPLHEVADEILGYIEKSYSKLLKDFKACFN